MGWGEGLKGDLGTRRQELVYSSEILLCHSDGKTEFVFEETDSNSLKN